MNTEIRIRRFEPGDVPGIYLAIRESVGELSRWMPWCRQNFSQQDAATWVEARPAAWESKTEYSFLICDQHETALGACGLNRIDLPNQTANLGYWIRTSHCRNGVATTAVNLLRDWAFENTDLHRLELLVSVRNVASLRVAEKSGALREGVLRDRFKLPHGYHDVIVHSLIRPPAH